MGRVAQNGHADEHARRLNGEHPVPGVRKHCTCRSCTHLVALAKLEMAGQEGRRAGGTR